MNKANLILNQIKTRWNQSAGRIECNILRRALLRDISRNLHAERSKSMASGEEEEDQKLRSFEKKIEDLLNVDLQNLEYENIGRDHSDLANTNQKLPKSLAQAIGNTRLDRFDRKWEHKIIIDAVHCMWQTWYFDAWIVVFQAEHFHLKFAQKLWPKGIVLFVEGCPKVASKSQQKVKDLTLWKGRWLVCVEQNPNQINLQWENKDGIDLSIEQPLWQKIV